MPTLAPHLASQMTVAEPSVVGSLAVFLMIAAPPSIDDARGIIGSRGMKGGLSPAGSGGLRANVLGEAQYGYDGLTNEQTR